MIDSPSSIKNPLLQSAAIGDLALLKKALLSEEGAVDINTTDEVKQTNERKRFSFN